MSEAMHKPLAAADDVEARAALWLEARDFGEWDEAAQTALNAWLEEFLGKPRRLLAPRCRLESHRKISGAAPA